MPKRQWRSFAWCSRQSEALLRKMDSEGSAHDVCSDAYGGVYPYGPRQNHPYAIHAHSYIIY